MIQRIPQHGAKGCHRMYVRISDTSQEDNFREELVTKNNNKKKKSTRKKKANVVTK